MDKSNSGVPVRAAVLAGACIFAVAAFRVLRATLLPELPNFSPVAAVAFCGGIFLPGAMAWAVPIGALVISDIALSVFAGFPAFGYSQGLAWLCVAGIVWLGRWFSAGAFSLPRYFGGLVGGAFGFYFVTNSAAWLLNPAYPRGFGGLWMSLTTGLPGFPPTWVFFRNSLVSDLLFGALILAVWAAAKQARRSDAPVAGSV